MSVGRLDSARYRFAQVGEWIIDCAMGENLIARFGTGP